MAEMIDAALATAGKPCELGNDPSKYLERFEDWYEHASLLADSIGVKDATQKLKLILLWGGRHFRRLVKDAEVKTDGETPDTLASALTKIRDTYSDDDTVGFVEVISVGMVTDTHQNNTIEVRVNGIRLILFVDSGFKKTLIPYTHYQPQLGELRPSNIHLRPYGVDHYLQVKGEIPAVLTSANGAKHTSVVYVVEGHLVEPLLGDCCIVKIS